MEFSLKETQDLLTAINEAQIEIWTGGPEGRAYYDRLEALKLRFRNTIPQQDWPMEQY